MLSGLRRFAANHALRLFELLADPDHTVLLYADGTGQLARFAEIMQVAAVSSGGRARTCVITPTPDLPSPGRIVIVDAEGGFRSAYGATGGSGYLVRPDGYLGFRASPITATALRIHLERVVTTGSPDLASRQRAGSYGFPIGGASCGATAAAI